MTDTLPPALTGIERAIIATGTQAALAAQLSSRFPGTPHPSQQAVSQWVRQGFVPKDRAKEIETITGVPFRELLAPALRELLSDTA